MVADGNGKCSSVLYTSVDIGYSIFFPWLDSWDAWEKGKCASKESLSWSGEGKNIYKVKKQER